MLSILIAFEIGVYDELNILYRQAFDLMTDTNSQIKIICTERQQRELTEHYKTVDKFIFNCRYLGDLFINDIKLYELIDYELENGKN
jgi:hypothetical protein